MRFEELKRLSAFQAMGDEEEAEQLSPHLERYINEGYERLASLTGLQPEALRLAEDEPILPEWMHAAIADFATWLLLRNGNPQRQARGMQYRAAYEETIARLMREGKLQGKQKNFTGIW